MISLCVKCNNARVLDNIKLALEDSALSNLYYSRKHFKVFDNIIVHYVGTHIETFYSLISKILYNQIINYYEPLLVMRILNQNYFYFDEPDLKIIMDEFDLLKEKSIYDKAFVERTICDELNDFLFEHKSLVLYGFVNFRLRSYINYLENMVNESVNQYLIDKEYVRFVNLLKNYVDSQIPSNKSYHLIYSNSNGLLLSEKGNIVELEEFKSHYVSDISFSQNDLILNTLVSKIPKKIIVHLIAPRDQFIKTIEMIFSERVQICTCCELCKTYKILENN